jgi:hypothetical protein
MKRVIYIPVPGEVIPAGAKFVNMPVNGEVVDCLVDDTFDTYGVVLYDSLYEINILGATEIPNHQFQGWEI